MRIDDIGFHHIHDSSFENYRPEGSGDWLMLFIKSPAIFYSENDAINVKENSFVIFSSDFPQHYKACDTEYIDDWLHFEPDENEIELIQKLEIPINTPVYIGDTNNVSQIISQMCFEFYSTNINRNEIAQLYFHIILYKLHEQMNCMNPNKVLNPSHYLQYFIWVRTNIYTNPNGHFEIDKIAEKISLSRSRFQHIYTEMFGVSFSQEILKSKIRYSCNLLTNQKLTLESIAEKCGYKSVSHFITSFKKEMKITPGEYRKKNSKPNNSQ